MKALVLALVFAGAPAGAGALSDLIMAPGLLAQAPQGEVLRYAHNRSLPAPPLDRELPGAGTDYALPQPVTDGEAILTATTDQLVLSLRASDGKPQDVASFPAGGSNPMLLFFLENVVRIVAAQTGGSPYYIRNRIKDALLSSDAAAGPDGRAVVTLHPFASDPNRARLGDFADLALSLALDPDRPGQLLDLKADTGPTPDGYSERMTLIEVK